MTIDLCQENLTQLNLPDWVEELEARKKRRQRDETAKRVVALGRLIKCPNCETEFEPCRDRYRFCSLSCKKSFPALGWLWTHISVLPSGCWEWTDCRDKNGYGVWFLVIDGKRIKTPAHRASWILHERPDPGDLFVCHHCDNPPCVNPLHCFLGTSAENTRDMIIKGRMNAPFGEQHWNSELNPEIVRTMRREYFSGICSMGKLAKRFKIGVATAFEAIHGKTWKNVGS